MWLQGEISALPLLSILHQTLLEKDAFVEKDISVSSWDYTLAKYGDNDQLSWQSPATQFLAKNCNKSLAIPSTSNTRTLSGVPSEKTSLMSQRRKKKKLLETNMNLSANNEFDWVLFMFPTEAFAQEANYETNSFF